MLKKDIIKILLMSLLIFSSPKNISVYASSPDLVSMVREERNRLKEKNKKLSKRLLYSSLLLTKKSVKEAIDMKESIDKYIVKEDWMKNLAKKHLWWMYIPFTLENRAVDPKFHIATWLGKINRNADFHVKEAANIEKIDNEEVKKIYKNLRLMYIEVEEAIAFLDSINRSKDKRLEINKEDLKEYKKIKFGKIGKDGLPSLSKKDEEKLRKIGEKIWARIYETKEWKKYQENLMRKRAKIDSELEEIAREAKREKMRAEVSQSEHEEIKEVFKEVERAFNERNAGLFLKKFYHPYYFGKSYEEVLEEIKSKEYSCEGETMTMHYSVGEPSIEGNMAKVYCVRTIIDEDDRRDCPNIYLLIKDKGEWKILTSMTLELGKLRLARAAYYRDKGKFVSSIEELVPEYIDHNTYRIISQHFDFFIDEEGEIKSRSYPDW